MLLQTDIRFLPKKILAEKEQKKEAKQRDAYRNTKKAQEEISKYHESLIDFIAELLSMVSSPVIKISKPTFFFNNEFIFTEFVVREFGDQIVEIDLRQEATDKWIIDAQNYLIDRGDQKYPTTSEHFVEKLLSNFHNEGIKLEKDIVIFKKENILLSERGFYICSRLLNNSNKWSSPFFITHANDADIFYHEDQELDEVDCEINIKNLQDKNPLTAKEIFLALSFSNQKLDFIEDFRANEHQHFDNQESFFETITEFTLNKPKKTAPSILIKLTPPTLDFENDMDEEEIYSNFFKLHISKIHT